MAKDSNPSAGAAGTPSTNAERSSLRPVLVTTQHRGVFFGYVPQDADLTARTLALTGARMAIRFGTRRGLMQLAETGPTDESRIGARADIPVLHDVTAVFAVAPEAVQKWEAA